MARDYARAFGRRVSDAMTRNVVSVEPTTPLSSIVSLMDQHKIKRVPVVEDGRVVGVVARADLLTALVRVAGKAAVEKGLSDIEALGEIRKRMGKESWAGATLVSLTVRGGIVKFAGIVAPWPKRFPVSAASTIPNFTSTKLRRRLCMPYRFPSVASDSDKSILKTGTCSWSRMRCVRLVPSCG